MKRVTEISVSGKKNQKTIRYDELKEKILSPGAGATCLFQHDKKSCTKIKTKTKQDTNGPHRSPEKTVQINKHI